MFAKSLAAVASADIYVVDDISHVVDEAFNAAYMHSGGSGSIGIRLLLEEDVLTTTIWCENTTDTLIDEAYHPELARAILESFCESVTPDNTHEWGLVLVNSLHVPEGEFSE